MKELPSNLKKNCENCRHGQWETDGDYGEYSFFSCEKREDDGRNNLNNNLIKESYRKKPKVCCDLMVRQVCVGCGSVELSNSEVNRDYTCFGCWAQGAGSGLE